MRSRLLAVLVALFSALTVLLGVPLGLSYAGAQAREVYIDRLDDLDRLARLVPATLADVDRSALLGELRRYEDVYGIPVAVVGADGRVVVTSRPGVPDDAPATRDPLRAALAGRTIAPPDRVVPWRREPLVVAQPVVIGGDVVAAVLSVSDLHRARQRVLTVWLLLAAGGLAALAAGVGVARGIARWVLQPVEVLDGAAHRLAGGDLGVRVPAESGPPELRRLGNSFNDMAGSVEASMTAQRTFVADASHQLRNPLGALLVRLEGLALDAPSAHRPAVERAVDDGRYLAETLDRMLELARAEHLDARAGPVDVATVVDARLESWRVVAGRREVTVTRTGAATATARHDAAAVAGALDAVLDNALKYSPDGTTVTVDVRPSGAPGDPVEIVVTDEGPGLADDELELVSDRFWRSRRHPQLPGSGLGLSIATTLLGRHGGRLTVAAAAAGGLEVRLEVPAEGTQGLAAR